ncbi:MAG: hypothetical protein ABSB15_26860 [Bryobacteraceae bacterium]|jgi:hypothetical protein
MTTIFANLKSVLAEYSDRLVVKVDTPVEYTLVATSASPFPQHKGNPMFFASVRVGKAYVSFHLMPLYMCPAVAKSVTPALKRRMQGKTCFNFKANLEPELIADLKKAVAAGFAVWAGKKWL